jgi:2-polyprenyl-3-methyl-5-hydroxy-6-metoxy-1,4-benzoquinol methylase
MKDAVAGYFNARSTHYERAIRANIFWAAIKRRETAAIVDLLGASPGERILDAGCGPGVIAQRLASIGCDVECIDMSPRMVEVARSKGLKATAGDIETCDLVPGFHKILCAGVLEFIADPYPVLCNLSRHLQGNGTMVVLYPRTTLLGAAYRWFHATHGITVRLCADRHMAEVCGRCALTVVEVRPVCGFTSVVKLRKVL